MRIETKKLILQTHIKKDTVLFCFRADLSYRDKVEQSMLNENLAIYFELERVKIYFAIKYKPKNENIIDTPLDEVK